MSTYKNLIGKDVNFLTTDPDNEQAEGQIWYNSTSDVFKNLVVSEAWSSTGSLGSGRYAMGAGTGGTVDAGIAVFGRKAGPAVNSTEEYNGSGWSTGGDGNTARYASAKFGTQTAAVAAGGKVTVPSVQNVEEYNGTSWSEETDYTSTARQYLSGFGILTAGVICGGHDTGGTYLGLTDEYDGTNWTTGGAMNNVRSTAGTTGILTAGLTFGGQTPSITATTEEYNGTSWTETGNMSTARSHLAGSGTQDAALAYGGFTPSSTTQTESYNGSTWSTSPATLATATARNSSVGSGASTGLSFGGNPPGTAVTEEYNRSANVITGAAWSAGGNMNTARGLLASAGTTQSAMLGAGGYSPPAPSSNTWAIVEEYNGSSWSEVNDLPTIKSRFRGAGTQTAAVTFGGFTPLGPNTNYNTTEKYDGTNWTTSGNMNTARCYMAGFGTQTAAVSAGGATLNPDVGFNKTEEYNGTSWSEVNNMPTYQRNHFGVGTLTAGVTTGGKSGPSSSFPGISDTSSTFEYDGTNWTAGGTSLITGGSISGGGTQTVAFFAGYPQAGGNQTLHYDGTSFITSASLAQKHQAGSGGAPQAAGIMFADASDYNAFTEEFTGETSALNIKTITTS